jgi:hypothetical protein
VNYSYYDISQDIKKIDTSDTEEFDQTNLNLDSDINETFLSSNNITSISSSNNMNDDDDEEDFRDRKYRMKE